MRWYSMLRKVLWWILLYAVFVYALVVFWPTYDFFPLVLSPQQWIDNVPFFLVLWWLLRLIYDVIRYVLKFITIPINVLAFGFVHLVINIWVLYLIPYWVNKAWMGTVVTMGNFFEVAIMAFMLSMIGLLFKYV